MYYSINQLNISERAKNALRKFHIGSIGDFKNFSLDGFAHAPGIGGAIFLEVEEIYESLRKNDFNTANFKDDFFEDRNLSKSSYKYLDAFGIHTKQDYLNYNLSDFIDNTTFQIESKNKIRMLYVIAYVTNLFNNKNDFLNDLSEYSVYNLDLDLYTLETIQKMVIRSLDELYCVTNSGIFMLENVEEKVINIVQEKLDEWLRKHNKVETTIHFNNSKILEMYIENHLVKSDILAKDIVNELSHYPIEVLELSRMTRNALRRNHIDTLLDLLDIRTDSSPGRGIGKKSLAEEYGKFTEWLNENNIVLELEGSATSIEMQEYEKIKDRFKYYFYLSNREVKNICEKNELIIPEQLDDAFILEYIKTSEMKHHFKKWFLNTYENGIVNKEKFENDVFSTQILENKESLFTYFKETIVDELDSYYILRVVSFVKYMNQHKNDSKYFNIYYMRTVDDKSLQELGDQENLTKERIRQIISKVLLEIPRVREDIYKAVFEYFNLNKKEFVNIFPNESVGTYNYLSSKYSRGQEELNQKNFETYNGTFKEAIEKYIFREEKSKASRTDVLRMMLKQRNDYLSLDDLLDEYNKFVQENGYNPEKVFESIHTAINHLRIGENIVFNHDNEVRYFEADYKSIAEQIDLSIYHDSVIAADLIYKDNIDLMPDFGIRDGYEMFYVLKYAKSIHLLDQYDISFRRVPIMVFNEVTEEAQMIKLLEEISPVALNDYFEIFEERYGVNRASAKSNFSKYITKYLEDGILKIDVPTIAEEDEETLKAELSKKDFWMEDEIAQIIKEKCKNTDTRAINVGSLERIGYRLNPLGYVFPFSYKNMNEYLESTLFNKEIIDWKTINPNMRRLVLFTSCFNKKKANLDYIEIENGVYFSHDKFEKEFGIKKEELKKIQTELLSYCLEDYFNAKTILPLLKESSVLTDVVIELLNTHPWLTTCLMRQKDGVYTLPYANTKLLSFNREILETTMVCKWIVDREGKMSLNKIIQRLMEIFGVEMDEYKLARIILSRNMWDKLIA